MKRNKGYTLVELLVSIAAFAIAMVSIVAIMSNTISAYSKANLDVTVQEDAQIVANQVEEYLCDATKISYDSSTKVYTCYNTERVYSGDGSTYTDNSMKYDFWLDGDELKFKATNLVDSSVKETSLADNVKDFSITSYTGETDLVGGEKVYNEATLNIEFDNNGSTYKLNRDVFFRNHIENNSFNSIKYVKGSSGGSTVVSKDEKMLNVKRYAEYNLTANSEFNIKYWATDNAYKNAVTNPNGNVYFYKKTGEKTFTKIPTTDTKLTTFVMTIKDDFPLKVGDYSDAKSYYLKAGSGLESNFSTSIIGSSDYYIVGYKDKDLKEQVIIQLSVDAVEAENTVIQVHGDGEVNEEPLLSPVSIKGLDVGAAVSSGKKCYAELSLDGKAFPNKRELKNYDIKADFNNCSCGQWQGGQLTMGVFSDPYNGGVFVGVNNDGAKNGGVPSTGKLKLTLSVDGKSVPTPEFKFGILGKGL